MKWLPVPLALAIAGLLASCMSPTGTSIVVNSTGGANGPTGYEVRQESPELANLIRVVRSVDKTEQGERVAQLDLECIAKAPVKLEYQIRWRDRFGSEFVTLWEWRHITLPPGKTTRIEDEVIDSEWSHYTWELKLAR